MRTTELLDERDSYIGQLQGKLDELNDELFAVKRKNNRLKGELEYLRREVNKARRRG